MNKIASRSGSVATKKNTAQRPRRQARRGEFTPVEEAAAPDSPEHFHDYTDFDMNLDRSKPHSFERRDPKHDLERMRHAAQRHKANTKVTPQGVAVLELLIGMASMAVNADPFRLQVTEEITAFLAAVTDARTGRIQIKSFQKYLEAQGIVISRPGLTKLIKSVENMYKNPDKPPHDPNTPKRTGRRSGKAGATPVSTGRNTAAGDGVRLSVPVNLDRTEATRLRDTRVLPESSYQTVIAALDLRDEFRANPQMAQLFLAWIRVLGQ